MFQPASNLLTRPSWRHATVCRVRGRFFCRYSLKCQNASRSRIYSTYSACRRSAPQCLNNGYTRKVLLRPYTRLHAHSSSGGSQPEEAPSPSPPNANPRPKNPSGSASTLADLQRRQQAQERTAPAASPSPSTSTPSSPRSPRASRMAALDPAAVLPRFQPGMKAGSVQQPGALPKMPSAMPSKGAAGTRPGAAAGLGAQVPVGSTRVAGRAGQQAMPGAKPAQAAASGEKRRLVSTMPSIPIPQNGDTVTGRVVVVREDYALVELFGMGRGMTGILEQQHVTKASSAPSLKSVLRPGMDVKALVINAAQRIISLSTAELETTPGALAHDPAAFFANADAVWLREFQSKGGTIIAPGKVPPPDTLTTDANVAPLASSYQPTPSTPSAPSTTSSSSPTPSSPSSAPQAELTTSAPKLKPKGRGSLFGKKRTASTGSAAPVPPAWSATSSGKNSDRLLQWKAVEDLCTSPQANRGAIMDAVKTVTKLLSGYPTAVPEEEKLGVLSAITQWVAVAKAHIATFTASELAAVGAIWVLLEQKKVTAVQDQSMGPVSDKLPIEMVSFLSQLAINAEPHLKKMSAYDLVCVVGAAGVTIPGRVKVEWLTEAEIASFGILGALSGDNLATVIYSFEQLGTPLKWTPNQSWLEAWLSASEPKLMTMGPRALSRAIKGLSGFKHKPSEEWIMKFNMSYQSRLQEMAPEDMANTLIGMAQLGIGGMGGQPGMSGGGDPAGGFGFDPNMPFPDFDDDMFKDFAAGAPGDMFGEDAGGRFGKDGGSMFDMMQKSGMNPDGMMGDGGANMFDMMQKSGMNPDGMMGDGGANMFDMMQKSGMNPEEMFGKLGPEMFDMMQKEGMNPEDMLDMMRQEGMNPEEMFGKDGAGMFDAMGQEGINAANMLMDDDDDDDVDEMLDADFVDVASGRKPMSSLGSPGAGRSNEAGSSGKGRDRGTSGITETAEFSDLPTDQPQSSSDKPKNTATS